MTVRERDFSKGAIWRLTLSQALPLMLAQLVQLLYNVVDRIYIGHMDGGSSIALTGVGLTFPVITFIVAFAALFGIGGVPLFSMANGSGERERAEKIMGCSCFMLITCAVVLTVCGYVFCKPILYLLGASDSSYPYAADYLRVYLSGTIFSMLTTGLNSYISAQGFPKTGMFTTIIGAVLNMLLDPLFIFVFGLGIKGAAAATVISQVVSAIWIMRFLILKAPLGLKRATVRFDRKLAGNICKLGTSNFVMQGTACFVQAACNSTLQDYGGDIYVGIMTVLNSVRDVFFLPISGLVNGSQPIMSYNYGAKKYDRVRQSIRFNTLAGAVYTVSAWLMIVLFPQFWFRIFSKDTAIIEPGVDAI